MAKKTRTCAKCDFTRFTKTALNEMDAKDITLVKISIIAFTLLVAKLWWPILILRWYWYLIIAVVAAWRPMKKIYFNKK